MQDFRPRLSSTYQPRQSLSHLVAKFENPDNRHQRASHYPVPRRAKTLPAVPPGQWLSSTESNFSEKQSAEEQPEMPSVSTFGQRHKSVAERRKLFEDTNVLPSDHIFGTRVFSRDVARDSTLPTNGQVSLQAALGTIEHADGRHSSEAIRQVRRMPRLEVARSRPPPSDEPEWPLKSDSPLRTSFESYHTTRTSVEWKPTPARERSLSRRRREIKPAPVEAALCDAKSTRNSSGEARTLGSTIAEVPSLKEGEEPAATAISVHNPQPRETLDRPAPAKDLSVPALDTVSSLPTKFPKTETVAASIGYPSTQTGSIPVVAAITTSQSHSVLFPAKNSGSWAAKQSSSPLQEKIGIFESLSRQNSAAEPTGSLKGDGRQPPRPPPQPLRNASKHAASLSRTASRIRATFRKIPAPWERGRAKHVPSVWKENGDGWNDHQETENNRTTSCAKSQATLNTEEREPVPKVNIRRFFSPVSSIPDNATRHAPTPYNSLRRGIGHKASSAGTSSDSMVIMGVLGSDNTTSAQTAPIAATPAPRVDAGDGDAPPNEGKRWISRSSGSPKFARVQCKLDQPMPVRGDELKRLVTLCKNSALRRRSRGQTG